MSPDQVPELSAIEGLTNVKIALLSQPLESSSLTVGADGGFDLPPAIENQPYRVTFTIPGESFEREIVWTAIDQARYVVPIFGPVDRTPPPANALIVFTGTGTAGFFNPSVLTTGLWSRTSLGNPTVTTGNPVTDDYNKTIPMGGPLGTLSTSDAVFLVDYVCKGCDAMHNTGFPNHIAGFAQSSVDLVAGTNAISGAWQAPPVTSTTTVDVDLHPTDRLINGLGSLLKGIVITISNAVVPSVAMPGAIQLREDGELAEPVMFALSNNSNGTLDVPVNPFVDAELLPPVLAGRWESTRLVNSTLPLTSGFTGIQDASDTDVVAVCVDMPSEVTLQDPSSQAPVMRLKEADFSQGPLVSDKTVPLVLTFTVDDAMKDPKCATKGLVTQDCVVTVFELGAMTTITKRVIDTVVTGPSVSVEIDPSAFDNGMNYSIAITCKSGYEPGAFAKGRFDAIQFPFSASTNYSSAFLFMTK